MILKVRLTADFGNDKSLKNLSFLREDCFKEEDTCWEQEKDQTDALLKRCNSSRFQVREKRLVLCNLVLEKSPKSYITSLGDFFFF